VATVDAGGIITGVAPGTATIRAASGSDAKTATLTVTAPFTALTLGSIYACAQTAARELFCWGANGSSQLGHLTGNETCDVLGSPGICSTTPRQGVSQPIFAQVAGGYGITCGLVDTGEPYCWGNNQQGQFGSPAVTGIDVPFRLPGSVKLVSVRAGRSFGCGLDSSGVAWCWGVASASYGNLGAPAADQCATLPCNLAPTRVTGGLVFDSLTVGEAHACGLTRAGDAYCWGANAAGQLGNGAQSAPESGEATPVKVSGGIQFKAISAGESHTCGLDIGGLAYCWGDNSSGKLGNNGGGNLTPAAVRNGLLFAAIGAGGLHTCALTAAGAAYCWGFGQQGQLGNGVATPSESQPTAVARNLVFVQLAVRRQFACGRTAEGRVYCWGQNIYGNLGIGGAGGVGGTPTALVPTGVGGVP
jgi:alpha-tubulin suppressor-like RCC1 family protein